MQIIKIQGRTCCIKLVPQAMRAAEEKWLRVSPEREVFLKVGWLHSRLERR